jgi:hypothetical protein
MKENEKALSGPMTEHRVLIDFKVYQKIMHWVNKAQGEVSGLGKVIIDKGDYRVVDAILVEQQNTGASTELEPASVAKAMYEMRETPGHLNFWWHSHVNMAVFWSGTDIDTIREIGQHGFVVATVFNKKNETRSAVYVKAGEIIPEIFLDNLKTEMSTGIPKEETAQWDAQFDAKCKDRKWSGDWGSLQETQGSLWKTQSRAWKEDSYWSDWRSGADDAPTIIDRTRDDVSVSGPSEEIMEEASQTIAESKEASTFRNIEQLVLDMEVESNHTLAREMLNDALRALNQLSGLSLDEKKEFKTDYVQRFNASRKVMRELEKSGAV